MTITLDTLTLPGELIWADEYTWGQVRSSVKRTVQGRVIVRENTVPGEAGRFITLESNNAWIQQVDLKTLREWLDTPDKEMLLTLHDSRTFTCRFRHWDSPCIESSLLLPTAYNDDNTYYKLTLKLMVI